MVMKIIIKKQFCFNNGKKDIAIWMEKRPRRRPSPPHSRSLATPKTINSFGNRGCHQLDPLLFLFREFFESNSHKS